MHENRRLKGNRCGAIGPRSTLCLRLGGSVLKASLLRGPSRGGLHLYAGLSAALWMEAPCHHELGTLD